MDLIVSQATEADIDQLATLVAKRYSPKQKQKLFTTQSIQETIRDRFEQGAKCFVGKIGTEMVHYDWIFFHRKEWSPGHYVHLSDREAYVTMPLQSKNGEAKVFTVMKNLVHHTPT